MKVTLLAIAAIALAAPAAAKQWAVDHGASALEFSGTHAGKKFTGKFGRWRAAIAYDPASLATSRVVIAIDVRSARTGDAFYDATLPQAEWFDSSKHPRAQFASRRFRPLPNGQVAIDGTLTLKGRSLPVTARATINVGSMPAVAKGSAVIDRLSFDLGAKSDPTAAWVSRPITISFRLAARPAA
jgi:cytochrome b561